MTTIATKNHFQKIPIKMERKGISPFSILSQSFLFYDFSANCCLFHSFPSCRLSLPVSGKISKLLFGNFCCNPIFSIFNHYITPFSMAKSFNIFQIGLFSFSRYFLPLFMAVLKMSYSTITSLSPVCSSTKPTLFVRYR